ncbi:hypothetical protein H1Q59_02335 [Holosporaceae bacterium 'Namur']|nr:hypothetical protein [Holosporaceae bacterium 'Namur']
MREFEKHSFNPFISNPIGADIGIFDKFKYDQVKKSAKYHFYENLKKEPISTEENLVKCAIFMYEHLKEEIKKCSIIDFSKLTCSDIDDFTKHATKEEMYTFAVKEVRSLQLKVDAEDLLIVFEALKGNTSINSLILKKCKINSDGAISLAEVLEENTSIRSLDLTDTEISFDGILYIAEAFKINTTIKSLELKRCGIGAKRAIAFIENSSLNYLGLSNNRISVKGAKALAEVLKRNSSLTSINLRNNFIETEGAIALAEALKVNTSLKSLILTCNAIKPEGGRALAEALKTNYSLTSLDLGSTEVGIKEKNTIENFLERNKELQKKHPVNTERNTNTQQATDSAQAASSQATRLPEINAALGIMGVFTCIAFTTTAFGIITVTTAAIVTAAIYSAIMFKDYLPAIISNPINYSLDVTQNFVDEIIHATSDFCRNYSRS